jgi:hypothetical protein
VGGGDAGTGGGPALLADHGGDRAIFAAQEEIAMPPKIGRLLRRLPKLVFVNLAVLIGLYLLTETVLHAVSSGSNPLLAKSPLRIRDPAYTHTLKPNFSGYDWWNGRQFPVFTNSLGFRDASVRDVPLAAGRKRVLFIGDSNTEGIGVAYEETFVGRIAHALREAEVLNAAVASYSPSTYYEKLKYYIHTGLKFDEAIVYIDISDMQDEASTYYYDEKGVLQMYMDKCSAAFVPGKAVWQRIFYIADFIYQFYHSTKLRYVIDRASFEFLSHNGRAYSRDWGRAAWTYDSAASCFGALGVEGAIVKARRQMDRLYELLSTHGIALSVGVYPWPQQLLYDTENSRQPRIWRDWCVGKCKQFFDHFPTFFRYKEKHPDFVRNLFIWGDIHYNPRGNQILADDFVEKYRP